MIAVNASEIRKEFKSYCEKVIDDSEPIIVTRQDSRNVVMISEDEYNNILENLYVRSDPEYYAMLMRSIDELKNGKFRKIDLKTLEQMGE
jgi:Antitoxin of toxin-antitoxin stability system